MLRYSENGNLTVKSIINKLIAVYSPPTVPCDVADSCALVPRDNSLKMSRNLILDLKRLNTTTEAP